MIEMQRRKLSDISESRHELTSVHRNGKEYGSVPSIANCWRNSARPQVHFRHIAFPTTEMLGPEKPESASRISDRLKCPYAEFEIDDGRLSAVFAGLIDVCCSD